MDVDRESDIKMPSKTIYVPKWEDSKKKKRKKKIRKEKESILEREINALANGRFAIFIRFFGDRAEHSKYVLDAVCAIT